LKCLLQPGDELAAENPAKLHSAKYIREIDLSGGGGVPRVKKAFSENNRLWLSLAPITWQLAT
jgi:hypothetical protein